MKNWKQLVADVKAWLTGEPSNPATRVDQSVKLMDQALDSEGDATSFLMALADLKYDDLQSAVRRVEELTAEAEDLVNGPNPDEGKARRVIFLKQQAVAEVQTLTAQYEELQSQSEARARNYSVQFNQLAAAKQEAPVLQNELALQEKRKAIQELTRSSGGFTNAAGTFESVRQTLRLQGRQLANKERLNADPNLEIDQQIHERRVGNKIDTELAAMRKNKTSGNVVALPAPDATANLVLDQAQALLAKPRFQGALIERQIGSS